MGLGENTDHSEVSEITKNTMNPEESDIGEENLQAGDKVCVESILKNETNANVVSETKESLLNQNISQKKPTTNVRFIVQPVIEIAEEISSSKEQKEKREHNIHYQNNHNDPGTVSSSAASGDDLNWPDEMSGYGGWSLSDPQAQLTVRSVASIGLGSSDGRKIHLRRVHTTGGETLLSPLLSQPSPDDPFSPWAIPIKVVANGNGFQNASCLSIASSCGSDDDDAHAAAGGRRHGQIWGSRLEFLLACIGFAVGLGNIWRFPYMAYKSGGGAFLIPYAIMVFLCAIPLQLLELAIGQYTREGPVDAMRNICPLSAGVGFGMVVLSLLLSSYYSVVMPWAMLYLGSSFTVDLPWTHCNNTWNTDDCHVGLINSTTNSSSIRNYERNSTDQEFENISSIFTIGNSSWNYSSPSQQFFDLRVLKISDGIDNMGDIQWELVGCLLLSWTLVYVTIRKGVRWSGKAVYVTATFPYILLLALTARALTLDGADEGLRHFFYPDWSLLLKAEVWVNALAQSFMSIGVAYGSLIAFSSYNRFHSPFVRDAVCLSALNSITSLVASIIVFAAAGHTSLAYNQPIELTANDGLSFSMVMYTTVVSQMPFPQFWAVLLFLMFICLGLDTQFATVEVIVMTIQQHLKKPWAKEGSIIPDVVAISICLVCFIGAIPYVSQGGIYLMQIADYFVATIAVVLLAFCEALSVGIVYGATRLARNVREMTAHSPSPLIIVCWAGVTPLLILGVGIFHMIDLEQLSYNHGQYMFPEWSIALGWGMLTLSFVSVPIIASITLYRASGKSLIMKFRNACKSQIVECPCCRRGLNGLKDTHSEIQLNGVVQQDQIRPPFAFAKFAEFTFPEDGTFTVTSSVHSPHPEIPIQFQRNEAIVKQEAIPCIVRNEDEK